jgi:hypothetical protein
LQIEFYLLLAPQHLHINNKIRKFNTSNLEKITHHRRRYHLKKDVEVYRYPLFPFAWSEFPPSARAFVETAN